MKTKSVNKTPVRVEAEQRSEMTISDVAKVFDMLATGLYSDVPQSIVREIWSNARDAHADAGNLDRPFEVTFPNVFNPTFRVRDYGIGLTHEQVMGVYTNLGESTKEDSNVGVGKFGIGSKSPFSYTDNFNVVTYMNGTKTFYSVVLEDTGIPAVYKMGEDETDEDNGVEVTFPIQRDDVNKFRTAAHRVAFGFDLKPTVTNSEGEADEGFEGWKELDVLSEGKGWKVLNGAIEGYRSRAYAKMGCVLYPLEADKLDGLSDDLIQMLNHSMIIEFPIGALDITPNREQLRYSRFAPTERSIKARLKGIIDEVIAETQKTYETCDTYWEACGELYKHTRSNLPSFLKDALRNNSTWNGMKLETSILLRDKDYKAMSTTVLGYQKMQNQAYRFMSETVVSVHPSPKTVIIIEDMTLDKPERKVASRIRQYYTDNRSDVDSIVWVRFFEGKTATQEMLTLLGKIDGATIVTADQLPEAPKYAGTRRPVQARRMSGYNYFDNPVTLNEAEMATGGLYVKLAQNQVQKPSFAHATPSDILDLLKHYGYVDADAELIAVPKTLWKRFEGDQWVDIYELAEKMFEEKYDYGQVLDYSAARALRHEGFLSFMTEIIDDNMDNTITEASEFFKRMMTKADNSKVARMMELAEAVGKRFSDSSEHAFKDTAEYYADKIKAEYPLMDILHDGMRYSNKNVDKVRDYVHTCDIANATTNQAAAAA